MRGRNRSRWREFVEGRDSVLMVVGLPILPSRLIAVGPTIGGLLRERRRRRTGQMERCSELIENLPQLS